MAHSEAIIIPCTREKVWDAQPHRAKVAAKDAYTSAAFRQWRAVAEASGLPWFILSTKYGLLHPDDPIEDYEVPVGRAKRDARYGTLLANQMEQRGINQCKRVVVLDWEAFFDLVAGALDPFDGPEVVLRKVVYG